ncbi:MAG: hypothetical protein AB7V16_07025 [Vulcanibacillus sp.]
MYNNEWRHKKAKVLISSIIEIILTIGISGWLGADLMNVNNTLFLILGIAIYGVGMYILYRIVYRLWIFFL